MRTTEEAKNFFQLGLVMFSHRLATHGDLPHIKTLMADAIGELQKPFLSPAQITASHGLMGLDTQLIDDATYFVIEHDNTLAGCGGWSKRATLFGGDHTTGRNPAVLNPKTDAARVRAMYTAPAYVRQGIGRLILSLCEQAAQNAGFERTELAATLAGVPLYRACGYHPIEEFAGEFNGIEVPLIRMGKAL